MASRKVTVTSNNRAVSIYNKKGEQIKLGTVVAEHYGDDEVRRFSFMPSGANPWSPERKIEKGYALGAGSKQMSFINPADAQEQLLEEGWKIVDQWAWKGGLQVTTIFNNPGAAVDDTIEHDLAFWEARGRKRGGMFPAVRLDTNLVIGRVAARYTAGVYRVVCTNGLISSVLNMGSASFSHRTWEEADLHKTIEDFQWTQALLNKSNYKGSVLGSGHSLRAVHKLLTTYIDASSAADAASAPWVRTMQKQLGMSANVLKGWTLEGFSGQLSMLADSNPDTIYSIDILNAYTNAVNAHRLNRANDAGVWRAMDGMDGVLHSVQTLMELSTLFSAN
jgi:hypothetical protein